MKHKLMISAFIVMIVPIIISAQDASGGLFTIEKSVVGPGGSESSGGAFSVTGTIGQKAAGTNSSNPSFNQIGGFWTPEQLLPTAAGVSIGGKIMTPGGNGIRNVMVTLTDFNGSIRTTVTGSFGIYIFTDVEVGQTYVLTVVARRHIFASPSQVISVFEELSSVNFVAEQQF